MRVAENSMSTATSCRACGRGTRTLGYASSGTRADARVGPSLPVSFSPPARTRGSLRERSERSDATAVPPPQRPLPGDAKSVVRIAKRRIEPAPRGRSADRHRMAPRSALRYAADAGGRARGIALGRDDEIAGAVPVGAPFVNVGGNPVEPVRIGRSERDAPRTGKRTAPALREPLRHLVAPWIPRALQASARGALPFGFCRQPQTVAVSVDPRAVGLRVVPAHADDRQIVRSRLRLPV